MDVEAYLKRIEYFGPREPALSLLRELHLAHLIHVPFENLSIHWNEPVVLERTALFEKIVHRRRGGFCFELNGLFASLLEALGFEVDFLTAGVKNGNGEFSPDFDHLTLAVKLAGETWLVDVGFGDSFRYPLRLNETAEQVEHPRSYRIESGDPYTILWEKRGSEPWFSQYRFRLNPYRLDDFVKGCRFHTTSPKSPFTRRRICSQLTPTGRITLSELNYIETVGENRHERQLSGEQEFRLVLQEKFGINSPG